MIPRIQKLPLGAVANDPTSPARGFVESLGAALPAGLMTAACGLPAWAVACASTVSALSLLAVRSHAARREARDRSRERSWLVIDDEGITRVAGETSTRLVRWSEPFGVTLFADRARTHLVFAFTTRDGARYVGANVTLREDTRHRALVAAAATLADHDLENSLASEDAWLSEEHADALIDTLLHRDAAAFARFYLSTPSGEEVVVDPHRVRVGDRTFSLHEPLAVRNAVFHESGGRVATIYHATVVAQGDVELAFIAPMPADLSWGSTRRGSQGPVRDALLRRALRRDSRLYAAEPEPPPSRDLRVAIDRLFMLPLRTMLDRAPRLVRTPTREVAAPPPANAPPGVTSRVS
ncbi:MAG: hypothetical protein U0169_14850 [Polyangiaceae bacterium]